MRARAWGCSSPNAIAGGAGSAGGWWGSPHPTGWASLGTQSVYRTPSHVKTPIGQPLAKVPAEPSGASPRDARARLHRRRPHPADVPVRPAARVRGDGGAGIARRGALHRGQPGSGGGDRAGRSRVACGPAWTRRSASAGWPRPATWPAGARHGVKPGGGVPGRCGRPGGARGRGGLGAGTGRSGQMVPLTMPGHRGAVAARGRPGAGAGAGHLAGVRRAAALASRRAPPPSAVGGVLAGSGGSCVPTLVVAGSWPVSPPAAAPYGGRL